MSKNTKQSTFSAGTRVIVLNHDSKHGLVTGRRDGWYAVTVEGANLKVRAKHLLATEDAKAKPAKRAARPIKGSIIKPEYREQYTIHSVVDASTGKKVRLIDNDDAVSNKLRGLDLDKLYVIAARTADVPKAELVARYSKLNRGQQSMNLRNRIRAAVKDGIKLTV